MNARLSLCLATLPAAVIVATPATAEPEYGPNDTKCRGQLLDKQPIIVDGVVIAEVQLYWARNENGLYCAVNYHRGPTVGKRIDTGVTMVKAASRDGPFQQAGFQRGDYTTVAGPIGSRGKCIQAGGGIDWKGARRFGYTRTFCT